MDIPIHMGKDENGLICGSLSGIPGDEFNMYKFCTARGFMIESRRFHGILIMTNDLGDKVPGYTNLSEEEFNALKREYEDAIGISTDPEVKT